jgi:small subunit ribosomal protein S1
MILDVNTEKERVSLGLKQKSGNPWDNIETKYPVGSRLRGKVVNLVPYGAFVELEKGVEGLVHVSEISWTKRIARASDVLSTGQEVGVVVLSVNREEQKIALGMRQTEENPWDGVKERYPLGARVRGKVRNFTAYGAFVELEDGIDGMIHVSDMSWTRKVNHPSEILKKGEDVDAVVLEVDADNQRISLGLKQGQEDPWATIAARYKVGQLVKGKVAKLASFGAFVELEEGIDGLVHISQISEERVEKVRDVLKAGQEVNARIVRIDPVERKIGLSIKAASVPDAEFVVKEEMLEGLRPGEDLVDLAGAFDAAFGASDKGEEWHPGEKGKGEEKDKDETKKE